MRLERLDAEFGTDARPLRLDTTVTFLRDGQPVRETVLRVNEPGEFDGYLVHPWTYGPAVRLRVTTLGGSPLLDAAVPLDETRDGVPVGAAELPTAGVTLGLALTDADRNELGVSVVGTGGLVDSARLVPGEAARVGDLRVELNGFDAWVTFMSRRDPGLLILFAGAARPVRCARRRVLAPTSEAHRATERRRPRAAPAGGALRPAGGRARAPRPRSSERRR